MQHPDVSIIIPSYNSEKTLDRLIKSIDFEDTRISSEIIIVDDASVDKSSEMCDEYARQHSNIKVLHHAQNMGPTVTRNDGLAFAKGDFFFFVDSDDEIVWPGFVELVSFIKGSDYEIVASVYDKVLHTSDNSTRRIQCARKIGTGEIIRGNELFNRYRTDSLFGLSACKIYRSTFLLRSGVTFANSFLEDQLFALKVFTHNPSYYLTDICSYLYHISEGSVSHSHDEQIAIHASEMLDLYYSFLEDKGCLEDNLDLYVPLNMRVLCWSGFKPIPYEGVNYSTIKHNLDYVAKCDSFSHLLAHPEYLKQLNTIPSKVQQLFYGLCYHLIRHNMSGLIAVIYVLSSPFMKMYVTKVLNS